MCSDCGSGLWPSCPVLHDGWLRRCAARERTERLANVRRSAEACKLCASTRTEGQNGLQLAARVVFAGKGADAAQNESAFILNVSQGFNALERVFPKCCCNSGPAPAVLDGQRIAWQRHWPLRGDDQDGDEHPSKRAATRHRWFPGRGGAAICTISTQPGHDRLVLAKKSEHVRVAYSHCVVGVFIDDDAAAAGPRFLVQPLTASYILGLGVWISRARPDARIVSRDRKQWPIPGCVI